MRVLLRLSLAALLASGCVHPLATLTERQLLTTQAGDFELVAAPGTEPQRQQVSRALERAAPVLERWGKLEKRVTIYLMPSHELLESAVRHYNFGWLRAWAQYDTVYLQTPATWSREGANDAEIAELTIHELTHCLMFQRAATAETWLEKKIPLWFREGMATWTANEGYKFPSPEDLARWYEQNPDEDPIVAPEGLYQSKNDVVYGAAHWAFTYLIKRSGEESVHRLLDTMRAGKTFSEACRAVLGITDEAFAQEFRNYLLTRAFRGGTNHEAAPLLR